MSAIITLTSDFRVTDAQPAACTRLTHGITLGAQMISRHAIRPLIQTTWEYEIDSKFKDACTELSF
jgi:hypothetical protein